MIKSDSWDIYKKIQINYSFELFYSLLIRTIACTLEWFLKDRVTLKTGVMMLKTQLCTTAINDLLTEVESNELHLLALL